MPLASRTAVSVSTGEEKPVIRTADSSAVANVQPPNVPRLRSATSRPCPPVRSVPHRVRVGELPPPRTNPCPVVSLTTTSSRTTGPVVFTNTPTAALRTAPRTIRTELSSSTATPGLPVADIAQSSRRTWARPLVRTPLPWVSLSSLNRAVILPRSPATRAEVPRCSTTHFSRRLSAVEVETTPAPAVLLIRHCRSPSDPPSRA